MVESMDLLWLFPGTDLIKSCNFLFHCAIGHWVYWIIYVFGLIIQVEIHQHLGFLSISLCKIYKQWRHFILYLNDGSPSRKMTDLYVFIFKKNIYSKCIVWYRSNVLYQSQMNMKKSNLLMFYPNKHIIVFLKVIYGFQ